MKVTSKVLTTAAFAASITLSVVTGGAAHADVSVPNDTYCLPQGIGPHVERPSELAANISASTGWPGQPLPRPTTPTLSGSYTVLAQMTSPAAYVGSNRIDRLSDVPSGDWCRSIHFSDSNKVMVGNWSDNLVHGDNNFWNTDGGVAFKDFEVKGFRLVRLRVESITPIAFLNVNQSLTIQYRYNYEYQMARRLEGNGIILWDTGGNPEWKGIDYDGVAALQSSGVPVPTPFQYAN